jgi:hypothetical protein
MFCVAFKTRQASVTPTGDIGVKFISRGDLCFVWLLKRAKQA